VGLLGLPLLVITVIGVAVASQMPHVHTRIQIYLHPELDLQGKGISLTRLRLRRIGRSVWTGLGESLQKLNYFLRLAAIISPRFCRGFGFVGISALIAFIC